VRRVGCVGDGVLGEILWWWSYYIGYNSEHPNKICNKNIKKNIMGSTMSGLSDAGVHILDGKATPSCRKP
jgi:hypothetical protein